MVIAVDLIDHSLDVDLVVALDVVEAVGPAVVFKLLFSLAVALILA
jgi:hypothetical protein